MKQRLLLLFLILCLPGMIGKTLTAQAQSIVAGNDFSFAIKSDSTLWAWGYNNSGQLGDGTTTHRTTPVKVMDGVQQVAGGSAHTLAIKTDGTLWAWGNNDYGQLGDGTNTNRYTPVKVMDGVQQVAGGYYHTLAIKTDGTLWAWGYNGWGQLGDGTTTYRTTPVKVMDGVQQVAGGEGHSLAIKTDGTLWAWGWNGNGELGDGTKTHRTTPVKVMDGVQQVTAGEMHSLAIKTDGTLWAWGWNGNGQLGNGTTTHRTTPVKMMDGVQQVAGGERHSLAIKSDGTLWAWGWNGNGQLGDGTTTHRTTPVKVMDGVQQVAGGKGHSLAIKTDGTLWAWGRNNLGQLGDGTFFDRTTPVKVMDDILIGVPHGQTCNLTIKDEDGVDVTNEATITWYDAEDQQIGTGSTIGGLAEGAEIYYSVELGERLGRIYREVHKCRVVVGEEPAVCYLERIGKVMLSGRVTVPNLEAPQVSIDIRQLLNGKYEETVSVNADEHGMFEVEAYDAPTDITVRCDGCFDATLHRNRLRGHENLGTIQLRQLTGSIIETVVWCESITGPGLPSRKSVWTGSLSNLELTLTNETTGSPVTDFIVQGNRLIIISGASTGDRLRLTARSRQGGYATTTTTFVLTGQNISLTLTLTEQGRLHAVFTSAANAQNVGFLFDAEGRLTARGSYAGRELTMSHLPAGTYTLVSMKRTLWGSFATLAELAATGLSQGRDYVLTQVEITDGVVSTVEVGDIPAFDEAPYSFTKPSSYFNVNKNAVMVGNYVIVSARVDLKDEYADMANGMMLAVDLPAGCRLVDNSVMIGTQPTTYTVDGQRLLVSLSRESMQKQIRFCVIPTADGDYTLTAVALFNQSGQVQQPIGSVLFKVKSITINVPRTTAETSVSISGTAVGRSDVRVYDNGVLIGSTRSNAGGAWTAVCNLNGTSNNSLHKIYAKAQTPEGYELTSETCQLLYNNDYIVPQGVTMMYYNQEYNRNYNIVFDLKHGTTTPSSYYYFPYRDKDWWRTRETEPKTFTFLTAASVDNMQALRNVRFKVLATDGTIRTLQASFDAERNAWMATSKYTSNKLPQNVTLEYDSQETGEMSNEETQNAQMNILANGAVSVGQYAENQLELQVIEESESSVVLAMTKDSAPAGTAKIELLDFEATAASMNEMQFDSYEDEEGQLRCSHTEYSETAITTVFVDFANSMAYRVTLYADDFAGLAKDVDSFLSKYSWTSNKAFSEWAADAIAGLREESDMDYLRDMFERYKGDLNRGMKEMANLLYAKCSNGLSRLDDASLEAFKAEVEACQGGEERFTGQLDAYLESYREKVAQQLAFDIVVSLFNEKLTEALKKTAKTFPHSKFTDSATDYYMTGTTALSIGNSFSKALELLFRNIAQETMEIVSPSSPSYGDTQEKAAEWIPAQYNNFIEQYTEIAGRIKQAYRRCSGGADDQEEYDDDTNTNKPQFPAKPVTAILDPSGYVYEAVLSNRLEGVTVTCYQKENGTATMWDAEEYSQQNPLQTDETGFYRWDVPMGEWQVKYEKDGYETAYSEWLPVPPPQMEVNMEMKQSTPPEVKQIRGFRSGITIEMTKFMRPETFTEGNITVTRNGEAEEGRLLMLNSETAPTSDAEFVSKVKFVPDAAFIPTDRVEITVGRDVESYCGVKMGNDHSEVVTIAEEVQSIVADSTARVSYQGDKTLQVLVLPKEASAGKTLHVSTSSEEIASVYESEVTIDENGVAALTVNGGLPGDAMLSYTLDESDMTAETSVSVVMGADMVATPQASVRNGETVEQGTIVELTCDTYGATIYYTLDGSCPCNEETRILYEEPIVITGNVMVKAMAVMEDMDDSDVATFFYCVPGGTGLKDSSSGKAVEVSCENGSIVIKGAEGGQCQIYDMQGRELTRRSRLSKQTGIRMAVPGTYIVFVQLANGQTAIYKLMVQN